MIEKVSKNIIQVFFLLVYRRAVSRVINSVDSDF